MAERTGGAVTAVVVPVPGARSVVTARGWTLPGRAAPHVTVLYPFRPAAALDADTLARLQAAVAGVSPFRFRLSHLARFTDTRVLYLAVDPVDPFVELTRRLVETFPEHPPYGGRFDEIVPHLTVHVGDEPSSLHDRIASRLPVPCQAESAELVRVGRRRLRRVAVLPLGAVMTARVPRADPLRR